MKNEEILLEDLFNIDLMCIYGDVDSKHNLFLKDWLKENDQRKLFFVEDDEKKFKKIKKTIDLDFNNKNVKTIFLEKPYKKLLEIAWEGVYLNLKIAKFSSEKRDQKFQEISDLLNEYHIGANVTSYVYSDFGISIFENVYNNLFKTSSFILFENLKDRFKNIPAVIVGAGPSLDKNIHLLDDMYDKALIFAGGSAINVFSKKNIRFHFSAHVDQGLFFKRFKNNHFFENLFFYQNRVNHNNLSLVQANKVLFPPCSSFPLESWIYDKLDLTQPSYETGWNVTTFLIRIAQLMGCNPITFVGLDLSFKKKKYSKGVTKEKDSYQLHQVKDINNNTVFTQKDWIVAKKWIEEFALNNPRTKFLNATEGGLKIENIADIKLLDLIDICKNSCDLDGYVKSVYNNEKKIKLEKEKVIQVLKIINDSLKNCNDLCDIMLNENPSLEIDSSLLRFQKEVFYTHLLDPFWQIWKHVILRNVEDDEVHILINKLIFFKNIISEHLKIMEKFL
ncbi:MAG: 6-hydroxymethylpterin diphosphokinase MptE-like protein [Parachlamydiales bacterium]|jgi:hypothetical protein